MSAPVLRIPCSGAAASMQGMHTRCGPLPLCSNGGSGRRALLGLQSAQKTPPHMRQWCRRRSKEKKAWHCVHDLALASAIQYFVLALAAILTPAAPGENRFRRRMARRLPTTRINKRSTW